MPADWTRPIVHFEILARDPHVQRRFYGELFDWPFDDGPIMSVPSGLGGPEPGPGGPTNAAIEDPEGNPPVLVQQ